MSGTKCGLALVFAAWAVFGWAAQSGSESGAASPAAAPPAPQAPADSAAEAGGEPDAAEPAAEGAEQETVEDIEAILTQPLGQDEYVEAERCISRHQFHRVEIIDNEHVLFEGRRGKAWLNTLRRPCIGLRRHNIPQFEYRGGSTQLCSLDDFVGIDRNLSGFRSASCALGEFQPVTVEQVALIKATVESRKKRNRSRKKKDPGEES